MGLVAEQVIVEVPELNVSPVVVVKSIGVLPVEVMVEDPKITDLVVVVDAEN